MSTLTLPLVELKNISVTLGNHVVFRDFSLPLEQGKIHVITGPSGCGKTTLLKTINGLVVPDSGSVNVFGVTINYRDQKEIRKLRSRIGYIPQHLGLVRSLSVLDNALMGCLARVGTFRSMIKWFPQQEVALAEHLLSSLGILEKAHVKVRYLSGGEKKRVAIARALMQSPKLLLADEFLSDLDLANAENIMSQVLRMKEEFHLTVIMVEHNMIFAEKFGDSLVRLSSQGKIITGEQKT